MLSKENKIIFHENLGLNKEEIVKEIVNVNKKQFTDNLKKILKKFDQREEIIVINNELFEILNKNNFNVKLDIKNKNILNFIKSIKEFSLKNVFKNEEEYYLFLKDITTELTREKIKEEQQNRDKLIIQAIEGIDEIDKIINTMIGRLIEWYGLYFPELYKIVRDNEKFVKIISEEPFKRNLNEKILKKLEFSSEIISKIVSASKTSVGAEFPDEDISKIQEYAKKIKMLYDERKTLDSYLTELMKEIAPNIEALVGPTIGARLIAKAGSLENLAKLPASTIQVLGAEKSLFKHLRYGIKPPKHGILFQHVLVHSSPKWQRGKIARLLSNKLAIASRADFYGQKDVSLELTKEIKERVNLIRKLYIKPPKKEKKKRRFK